MSGYKLTIFFGILAVLGMCLYPPFTCVGISSRHELSLKEGYYPLFSPPQNQNFNTGRSAYAITYQVDTYRLFGQIIFTGVASISIACVLYAIQNK